MFSLKVAELILGHYLNKGCFFCSRLGSFKKSLLSVSTDQFEIEIGREMYQRL